MKTLFKYLPVALMALTGCTDWSDHYDDLAAASGSDMTLWQTLEQRPELSDFREVLSHTEVFRMHKKTGVSYAQLLNSGQSFTVMAPINGTFNKDSILQLVTTNYGDSAVEKSFVGNHLSRSTTSAIAGRKEMRLANTKRIMIGDGKVGNVGILDANIHAKNGVLHVVEHNVPYAYNLYEAMCDLPQFKEVGNILRLYEEDEFDENASLSNGTIDGVPVYIDSVVVERNKMLEAIGLLNAEDSTYRMVVPSKEGWQRAWQKASEYFVYDKKVAKSDSISRHWITRALLDDAIYNMTLQDSPEDSLISVQYNRKEPKYHVFYNPYAADGVLGNVERTIECSNGILYETKEWPFRPEQTFFREIKCEAEDESLILANTSSSYNSRMYSADSVSGTGYLDIVPETELSNWTMTFNVKNTIAGAYDICAIILPNSIYNNVSPNTLSCKFRASVIYVNEKGEEKSDNLGNTVFTNNPFKVDTVVVARGFKFPVCNYDQINTKIKVKLTCYITKKETDYYSREMFLDCIFLRPTSNNEE